MLKMVTILSYPEEVVHFTTSGAYTGFPKVGGGRRFSPLFMKFGGPQKGGGEGS